MTTHDHQHMGDLLTAIGYAVIFSFALWWAMAATWHASPFAIEDLRCRIELLEGTPEPDGAMPGGSSCP